MVDTLGAFIFLLIILTLGRECGTISGKDAGKREWIASGEPYCIESVAQVLDVKHTIKRCWIPQEVKNETRK
jgi:hypothetical protein